MNGNFFKQVYRVVTMIPPGKVATYGRVAAYLGAPHGARAVGWALRALPEDSDVPWHRVINAQGRISTSGGELDAHQQRVMLEEEGIVFDDNGSTDLRKYGWEGLR